MTGGGPSSRHSSPGACGPCAAAPSTGPRPDAAHSLQDILHNVGEVKRSLLQQIDILRLKIQVDESNYSKERTMLLQQRKSLVEAKDTELGALRQNLAQLQLQLQQLRKDNSEKQSAILRMRADIEQLQTVLGRAKDHGDRIHKRFKSDQKKVHEGQEFQRQVQEFQQLDQEVKLLQQQMAQVQQGLLQLTEVIEEQDTQLKTMFQDRLHTQSKFADDINKVIQTVRRELKRTSKILQLTYEGVRACRTENAATLNAVTTIKDVLSGQRSDNGGHTVHPRSEPSHQESLEQSATAAADRRGRQMNSSRLTTDSHRHPPGTPVSRASPLTELPPVVDADRQESLYPVCVFISSNKDDVSEHTLELKLFPRTNSKAVLQENRPATHDVVKRCQLSPTRKKVAIVPVCMLKTGVLHARRQTTRGQVRKGSTIKKL
ncbi:hypothetical protein BsWGS_19646 [Bradybaena similaris]